MLVLLVGRHAVSQLQVQSNTQGSHVSEFVDVGRDMAVALSNRRLRSSCDDLLLLSRSCRHTCVVGSSAATKLRCGTGSGTASLELPPAA
jgi:hypothetical protein